MVDVDVKDQGGTASITVYSGTNQGGNDTNWTFNDTCTGAPTVVKLIAFSAASSETGEFLLSWRTGYEVNNLGFHLYREENGELFRVTPGLIAGSAFLTGTGTPLTAGRSYAWFDATNVEGSSRTAGLEDRPASGLRGAAPRGPRGTCLRHLSPQVTPQAERSLSHAEGVTVLLARRLGPTARDPARPCHAGPLGQAPVEIRQRHPVSDLGKRQNQKYDEFWRIQEIRERLMKDRPAERGLRTGPAGLEDRPARDSRTQPL